MKKILIAFIVIILSCVILVLGINFYVVGSTKKRLIKNNNLESLDDIDCILVLGCGVWGEEPSPMLRDRLEKGIELYKKGVAKKIIMSGDHGRSDYDEVNVMKKYAIDRGVSSEDIFMDHAGFSTYESMYRAKEVFNVKSVVIVSQEYHLYRAIYIAKNLGLNVYGVNSEPKKYIGQFHRDIREILARNKDFVTVMLKPEPTYLGDVIPVSGNGDVTNDK